MKNLKINVFLRGIKMTRKILVLLFLASLLYVYSCKTHDQTSKYFDSNDKRISEKEFQDNGENGKIEIVFWGENGQKFHELVEYRNGKENGKCVRWAEDGFKIILGEYKGGKKHGNWIYQHRDGTKDIDEYKDNQKHGKSINWDSKGRKRMEEEYKEGKQHGRTIWWDEKGNIVLEEIWVDGNLVNKIK